MIIRIPKLNLTVLVAQWIARWTSNPKAVGSNPTRDEYIFSGQSITINVSKKLENNVTFQSYGF